MCIIRPGLLELSNELSRLSFLHGIPSYMRYKGWYVLGQQGAWYCMIRGVLQSTFYSVVSSYCVQYSNKLLLLPSQREREQSGFNVRLKSNYSLNI